ncbi:MAG: hypothetical protein LQ352_006466 [Teloschistes flavicans]|nr:MAG: hypothetical protein LQ352_006466 [Teloschistes flavicans]
MGFTSSYKQFFGLGGEEEKKGKEVPRGTSGSKFEPSQLGGVLDPDAEKARQVGQTVKADCKKLLRKLHLRRPRTTEEQTAQAAQEETAEAAQEETAQAAEEQADPPDEGGEEDPNAGETHLGPFPSPYTARPPSTTGHHGSILYLLISEIARDGQRALKA